MINWTGIRILFYSCVIAALLCYGYLHFRKVPDRGKALKLNQQAIEQVRKEVNDLEIRLERARARVKALENDPVEAQAAARSIGGAVGSKMETVFHVDESKMTSAASETAAPPVPAPPPPAAP